MSDPKAECARLLEGTLTLAEGAVYDDFPLPWRAEPHHYSLIDWRVVDAHGRRVITGRRVVCELVADLPQLLDQVRESALGGAS